MTTYTYPLTAVKIGTSTPTGYQLQVVVTDLPQTTGNRVSVVVTLIAGTGTGRYASFTGWITATGQTQADFNSSYDTRTGDDVIMARSFVYTIAQGSSKAIAIRVNFTPPSTQFVAYTTPIINYGTVYPSVTIQNYTIYYYPNGGSAADSSQTLANGSTGTFPNPGIRTNYTFAGWGSSLYSTGDSTPALNGADASYSAQWTALTWTVSYNANGGTVSPTSSTVNRGGSVDLPTPSRTGYTFNGWGVSSPYTPTADTSLTASWTANAPGFTNETVSSPIVINQNINTAADYSVAASNTTSYSIKYSGSGLNPTSWLSINNSGQLSGFTNIAGVYTFVVTATGTTSQDSNLITLTVRYPGRRTNSTLGLSLFSNAKRWDGSQWVSLSIMRRWNGSQWVDITN